MICYLASMGSATDRYGIASMLEVAIAEARKGAAESGVPIGAAVFDGRGALISAGANRCVQDDDMLLHAEIVAIRRSGRLPTYHDKVLVTTLVPCWYCSGLIRFLGFGRVVVGDSTSFPAPTIDWLRESGVQVEELHDADCASLLQGYIETHPDVWFGDPGVATALLRETTSIESSGLTGRT